jgi:transposase
LERILGSVDGEVDDVSTENDRGSELESTAGFGGRARKERIYDAVEVFARAGRLPLLQAEGGTPIGDLCRQLGVSEATSYTWKKKYAHLGVSELRRLR